MKSEWKCCCWKWIPSWYCLVGMKLIPYHKVGHFKGGHQKGSRPIPVKHKEKSTEPNPDQLRNSSMEASRRRTWKKESETSGSSTVRVGHSSPWSSWKLYTSDNTDFSMGTDHACKPLRLLVGVFVSPVLSLWKQSSTRPALPHEAEQHLRNSSKSADNCQFSFSREAKISFSQASLEGCIWRQVFSTLGSSVWMLFSRWCRCFYTRTWFSLVPPIRVDFGSSKNSYVTNWLTWGNSPCHGAEDPKKHLEMTTRVEKMPEANEKLCSNSYATSLVQSDPGSSPKGHLLSPWKLRFHLSGSPQSASGTNRAWWNQAYSKQVPRFRQQYSQCWIWKHSNDHAKCVSALHTNPGMASSVSESTLLSEATLRLPKWPVDVQGVLTNILITIALAQPFSFINYMLQNVLLFECRNKEIKKTQMIKPKEKSILQLINCDCVDRVLAAWSQLGGISWLSTKIICTQAIGWSQATHYWHFVMYQVTSGYTVV